MGFFLTGCVGSCRFFTNLVSATLFWASIWTFKGAPSTFALLRMANRARLLGEGGSTCDSLAEFSGAVAKRELAAKVLGLRLRLGEANPGGALNPSGLGIVACGDGPSMSMGSEAASACAGGGVKNKGGCWDIPAGVPCMVSSRVLWKLPHSLLALLLRQVPLRPRTPVVRRCFTGQEVLLLDFLSMPATSLSEQHGVLKLDAISASEDMAEPISVLSSSNWRSSRPDPFCPFKSCRFLKNPNFASPICATG